MAAPISWDICAVEAVLNNCCDLSKRYVKTVLRAVSWRIIFVGTSRDGALTKNRQAIPLEYFF